MGDADILDSRYSWIRLSLSLLIATIGNAGVWAIIVVMPAIQAEFAIDRAGATLPYTLTMVGFGPLMADISLWFLRRRGIAVAIVASGNYLSGAVWPDIRPGAGWGSCRC